MSAPDSDPTARPTAVAPDVVAARAIPLIDLTDLADDHSVAGIDLLCDRAAASGVAAVCVWPEHVARCVDRLGPGSPVRVATVVNFPAGTSPVDDVVVETSRAIADGADEIDVVLPYRRLLDGDEDGAVAMLGAIRAVCTVAAGRHDPTAREVHLKVILETGELGDLGVVARAAELAIAAGADFVKTSTGKTATGATPDAVRTMLQVIAASSRRVGIKPSGGIRTTADAAALLEIADEIMGPGWTSPATFRFGASSLLDDLEAARDATD